MLFIEELVTVLQGASVGTFGTNIFAASVSSIPDVETGVLTLRQTPGPSPIRIQNSVATPNFVRPNAQILARAEDVVTAKALAHAAYDALYGVRNTYVGLFSPRPATSVSRVGSVATLTTPTAHGLFTGQKVNVAGAAQADYNVSLTRITVVSTVVFTYPVSGSPASPATGSITYENPGVFYQDLIVLQQPFDLGLDSNGRAQFAFNITAVKKPS